MAFFPPAFTYLRLHEGKIQLVPEFEIMSPTKKDFEEKKVEGLKDEDGLLTQDGDYDIHVYGRDIAR